MSQRVDSADAPETGNPEVHDDSAAASTVPSRLAD